MANTVSRSKRAFYDAFVELVKELPLEKITVGAIVEKSGYSKGAFYKQFESRDEFLKAVVDDEIDKYINISRDTYKESGGTVEVEHTIPVKSLCRLFDHVYTNRELYRFIFSNYSYFNTVEYFFTKTWENSPHYEIEYADDLPCMDGNLWRYLSMYVHKAVIKYWIDHDFDMSPEYMATQCTLFQRKTSKKITLVENKKKEVK